MPDTARESGAPGDAHRPGRPGERVPRRWAVAFCVAVVGTFAGWYGPLQILLAKQAEAFSPGDKEEVLALVALSGAAVSAVANPVWGALSDRTTSRFGKRIPWVVGGALGGAVGLLVLAAAHSLPVMIVGWCLVQLALNAPLAALSAAVADQVPVARRGTAGGYFGVAQTVGVITGTGLAVAGGSTGGGYAACALFVLLSALPYALLRQDLVLPRAEVPPWDRSAFLRGFWISPRKHPDFAWAWLTRFLMNLGNAVAMLYLLYFLKDELQLADPDAGVLVLTVINASTLLLAVAVGGLWSDRLGRRRVFVLGAGLVMAAASFMLAGWQTWTGAVVAAIVLGLGFGVYTSVDFALLTQVLPSAEDRARDLGVLNIANSLPQVLAPVAAAPIVHHLGGYPALYTVSALLALAGAVLVFRIRSVP